MKTLRYLLELLKLTLPFPLNLPHGILCSLPDEALFELEEAPFFGGAAARSRQHVRDAQDRRCMPGDPQTAPSVVDVRAP
jgi:hypothetical protein